MAKIKSIRGRKIFDSRGKSTIEVEVTSNEGLMAVDSVPSGTSTGQSEAVLIDTERAINNINEIIAPKIIGLEIAKQEEIDQKMIALDGTENKSRLGANATLGISLAVARAAAYSKKMPLYWYLNHLLRRISKEEIEPQIPLPMMVMICGGKHGQNRLCIQEFLVIGKLEDGIKIWHKLKERLKEKKIPATLGLEGAFSPQLDYDEDALEEISESIKSLGLKIGEDIRLGLDVAGNNCQMINENLIKLFNKFNLYSIEDPFDENSWEKFGQLKLELEETKKDFLLVGDDLFATHKNLLEKGLHPVVANSIIIKPNQVGTLTETLEVIALAQKAKYTHIISHRSGETTDTFIADLAVGTAAKFIKSGAPVPRERLLKYKRLEEIEGEL